MSSKVLSGPATAPVQPMEWRRAPLGPVAPRPNLYSAAAQEDASPEQPSEALRQEIERKVQAAHQRGLREGEAAAAQAAASRVKASMEGFARAVEDLAGYRDRLRRQAEKDLIKLAMAIARRILRRELSVDAEALVGVAKAAIEKLGAREACRVRVNPAYAVGISRYLQSSGLNVTVVEDRGLEPGAALFETATGSLDAGIETQLAEIERGLTDLCSK